MPRKLTVVNINDDSTYGEVAEAIVENEKAENEPDEETKTEEVVDPLNQPSLRHEQNVCRNLKLLKEQKQ